MSRLRALCCGVAGLGGAAAFADIAWAHISGASGGIGWRDEGALVLVPLAVHDPRDRLGARRPGRPPGVTPKESRKSRVSMTVGPAQHARSRVARTKTGDSPRSVTQCRTRRPTCGLAWGSRGLARDPRGRSDPAPGPPRRRRRGRAPGLRLSRRRRPCPGRRRRGVVPVLLDRSLSAAWNCHPDRPVGRGGMGPRDCRPALCPGHAHDR
jgi:hypothetical protein